MPCRYLEQRGAQARCRASEPVRTPGGDELRARCHGEALPCPFHRFMRASGKPLRMEDFLAWQKRAQTPLRPRKPAPEPS